MPVGSPGAITFGLSAVRNVGEGLVELLVNERDANGPFGSFHDFVERVPEPVLNKRTVESLIKGGALICSGTHAAGCEPCSNTSSTRRSVVGGEREGVMSLFGDWGDDGAADADDAAGFSERTAIPVSSSTRPTSCASRRRCSGCTSPTTRSSGSRAHCRRKVEQSLRDLPRMEDGAQVVVGGVITSLVRKFTKRGDQMASFRLEDLDASSRDHVVPTHVQEQGYKLDDDLIVTIKGRLDRRDESRLALICQT